MEKKILQNSDLNGSKLISQTESSTVVKLNNGSVLKIYRELYIDFQKFLGINLEEKILAATPIIGSPEILVPKFAIYNEDNKFCGYIMPKANGIDYNTRDEGLTMRQRVNLQKYAEIHFKLESILKRNTDIVFPDLCTCDNIFVDSRDNIQLIDYDGLQIGKHRTLSVSTSLGELKDILTNPKYHTKDGYFTKELDKKSLIILYFLSAFNIDLNKVGMLHPITRKPVKLEEIFKCLNLDDYDFCQKVWKIFQDNQTNEYLGDDVFRIADKYDMEIYSGKGNAYVKKLKKKK